MVATRPIIAALAGPVLTGDDQAFTDEQKAQARANIGASAPLPDTDALSEGAANRYFTRSRARRLATLDRLRAVAAAADLNNPEDLPVMASPPVVTTSASASGALSNIYTPAVNPTVFRVAGGVMTQNVTNSALYLFPATKHGNGTTSNANLTGLTPDAEDNQSAWSVTVQTDADAVEFRVCRNSTAGRCYRFIVDGRYVDKTGTDLNALAGLTSYIKLDFTGLTPARKVRTITIEGVASGQHQFAHVAVGPTSSVWYPAGEKLTGIFGGDSFTQGNGLANQLYYNTFAWKAGNRLGFARTFNLGINSTGYTSTGGGSFRKQADQVVHDWSRYSDVDVVFLAAGYNDKSLTQATVMADALAAWQAVRSLYPDALIVVCGVWGGNTGPSAATITCENNLKTQFDAWADSFSVWIPVSTDVSPWQSGTGRIGATTGVGNSDVTTGTDNVHPSEYGHEYLSARLARAFRNAIARLA